jgi:hypothetical protein
VVETAAVLYDGEAQADAPAIAKLKAARFSAALRIENRLSVDDASIAD